MKCVLRGIPMPIDAPTHEKIARVEHQYSNNNPKNPCQLLRVNTREQRQNNPKQR